MHWVMKLRNRLPHLAILGCLFAKTLPVQSQSVVPAQNLHAATGSRSMPKGVNTIVLPSPLSDPIEPFNRAVWNFNAGLMSSVIKPASKGYRFVVPKPVRQGIGNAGRNLTTPVRFINELLQCDWQAFQDETKRCFFNTVFGFGGIFDVATR